MTRIEETMTKSKAKRKVFTGFIRKSEWNHLRWKEKTLRECGSFIGNSYDFNDDIKVQIIIEELQ